MGREFEVLSTEVLYLHTDGSRVRIILLGQRVVVRVVKTELSDSEVDHSNSKTTGRKTMETKAVVVVITD